MTRLDLTPRQSISWLLFAGLALIAIVGRALQPEYHVTPLAAVTLFAAMCYTRVWMTALLPVVTLAVGNLILPEYNNRADLIAVYGCMAATAALQSWLRAGNGWGRIAAAAFVPSAFFFLVTNFVVWTVRRGMAFEDSFAGLLECYNVAVPFYTWMLQGDLIYTTAIFGTFALCSQLAERRELVPVRVETRR